VKPKEKSGPHTKVQKKAIRSATLIGGKLVSCERCQLKAGLLGTAIGNIRAIQSNPERKFDFFLIDRLIRGNTPSF
jgi:hypothetical protein